VQAQLTGQVGDVPPGGDPGGPAVVSRDGRSPRCRAEEAQEDAQGRGLARAIGPQQAEDLTAAQGQGQAVQGPEAAVVLGELLRQQQGRAVRHGGHFFSAMHHRFLCERMNSSPSLTAMLASTFSPREFVASTSYFGSAARTRVSPFWSVTYNRPATA